MTLYYSEINLENETISHLEKLFPRCEIGSNFFKIPRASTIDNHLLLNHFDAAVSKEHNLYKASITLPVELCGRVPQWYVKSANEFWVEPKPELNGKNIHGQDIFMTNFHLYVNEDSIHKIPDTRNIPVDEALIREFIEIKHALVDGNEEPIDVFRGFYTESGYKTPKSQVSKYLLKILTTPH